jgi:glycosyltransferase involved in cell wall biosynthesis
VQRSVLIVTPFFAPQNHSAVFRAHKLAKYLPQFGWRPIVLTVDTQYEFNEDPGLLTDLPKEVEITRSRYIEPTIRGLRMALGGGDRTFKATRSGPDRNGNDAASRVSTPHCVYKYLLANWLQVPDAYWTWANTAITSAKKIMLQHGTKIVFTTAPPFSSLTVGRVLQNAGAKWIADFRDPLAYTQRLSSDAPRIYQQQRDIVRTTLESANAITLAASSFSSIYFDIFGRRGVEPVFIPTGMDASLLEGVSDVVEQQNPYLVFPGEYLPDYDTAFLSAFAAALKQPQVRSTGIKLLVIGTLQLNRTRLMPLLDRFELQEHVQFIDQRPQREVYKVLRGARAGVLIPGTRAYWWTTFAKMTDFIGMCKPVLAVVPDPSEARTALMRARLGIFLDGTSEQRTKTLTDFLLGKLQLPAPDENECRRYTARRQVQSFVEIFESVAKQ